MTVLVILAVGLISLASAKEEKEKVYAPLPKKILEAKTVALDNQTGNPGLGDKVYEALIKWDRFRVIDRSENPDLVIVLFKERNATVEYWVTYLSVADPLTGEPLWRAPWDAERRKIHKGYYALPQLGLIMGARAGYKSALEILKERIEIQEKSAR
jgi:hypothetical protein